MNAVTAASAIPPPPRPTPATFNEQHTSQAPEALLIWRHGAVQTPACENCRKNRRVDPFGACVVDVNGVLGGGGCASCVYVRRAPSCSIRLARTQREKRQHEAPSKPSPPQPGAAMGGGGPNKYRRTGDTGAVSAVGTSTSPDTKVKQDQSDGESEGEESSKSDNDDEEADDEVDDNSQIANNSPGSAPTAVTSSNSVARKSRVASSSAPQKSAHTQKIKQEPEDGEANAYQSDGPESDADVDDSDKETDSKSDIESSTHDSDSCSDEAEEDADSDESDDEEEEEEDAQKDDAEARGHRGARGTATRPTAADIEAAHAGIVKSLGERVLLLQRNLTRDKRDMAQRSREYRDARVRAALRQREIDSVGAEYDRVIAEGPSIASLHAAAANSSSSAARALAKAAVTAKAAAKSAPPAKAAKSAPPAKAAKSAQSAKATKVARETLLKGGGSKATAAAPAAPSKSGQERKSGQKSAAEPAQKAVVGSSVKAKKKVPAAAAIAPSKTTAAAAEHKSQAPSATSTSAAKSAERPTTTATSKLYGITPKLVGKVVKKPAPVAVKAAVKKEADTSAEEEHTAPPPPPKTAGGAPKLAAATGPCDSRNKGGPRTTKKPAVSQHAVPTETGNDQRDTAENESESPEDALSDEPMSDATWSDDESENELFAPAAAQDTPVAASAAKPATTVVAAVAAAPMAKTSSAEPIAASQGIVPPVAARVIPSAANGISGAGTAFSSKKASTNASAKPSKPVDQVKAGKTSAGGLNAKAGTTPPAPKRAGPAAIPTSGLSPATTATTNSVTSLTTETTAKKVGETTSANKPSLAAKIAAAAAALVTGVKKTDKPESATDDKAAKPAGAADTLADKPPVGPAAVAKTAATKPIGAATVAEKPGTTKPAVPKPSAAAKPAASKSAAAKLAGTKGAAAAKPPAATTPEQRAVLAAAKPAAPKPATAKPAAATVTVGAAAAIRKPAPAAVEHTVGQQQQLLLPYQQLGKEARLPHEFAPVVSSFPEPQVTTQQQQPTQHAGSAIGSDAGKGAASGGCSAAGAAKKAIGAENQGSKKRPAPAGQTAARNGAAAPSKKAKKSNVYDLT